MSRVNQLKTLLVIFLLLPILRIGGLRYYLPEFLPIILLLFNLLIGRSLSLGRLPWGTLAYCLGFCLLIMVCLPLENRGYDAIQLGRNIISSTATICLVSTYTKGVQHEDLKDILEFFAKLCVLLFLVTLAALNYAPIRDLIYTLYDPQINHYDSVGFLYSGIREPGVFKDYFTYGVFLIVSFYVAQYSITACQGERNTFLRGFQFLCLFTAFAVGRTPTIILALSLLYFNVRRNFWSNIIFLFFLLLGIASLSTEVLDFALEFVRRGGTASGEAYTNTITGFWSWISSNPKFLLVPAGTGNYTVALEHYSDNFYIQELMRFGVYGVVLSGAFGVWLIRASRGNRVLQILFVILAGVNLKGGNVFFMERCGQLLWTVGTIMFILGDEKVDSGCQPRAH